MHKQNIQRQQPQVSADANGSRVLVAVDKVVNIGNPDNQSPHPFITAIKSLREKVAESLSAAEQGYFALIENRGLFGGAIRGVGRLEELDSLSLPLVGLSNNWLVTVDKSGEVSFELQIDKDRGISKKYTISASASDADILDMQMPVEAVGNYLRRAQYILPCFEILCAKAEGVICDALIVAVETATRKVRERKYDLTDAVEIFNKEREAAKDNRADTRWNAE